MPFWEITKKDLRLLVRDSRALFLLVAIPLIFITIIGLTTGQLLGWKNKNEILRIGVVDQIDYKTIDSDDDRRYAQNMTRKIINGIGAGKGRRADILPANADYQKALDQDNLDLVVVIGPDFFNKVKALEPEDVMSRDGVLKGGLSKLDIQLYTRLQATSGTRSIIEDLLFDLTLKTIVPYVFCEKFHTNNYAVNAQLQRRMGCIELRDEKVALQPNASGTEEKEQSNDSKVMYTILIPSYTVLFVFFLVNIMARSFLHERDLGTLRRLRMAPITRAGLISGKTIPFLIISLVQTALLFTTGKLLFGMSWGNIPVMLIPVILTTSMAATGLGLLVATLVRSDSQVSAYANIVVIAMGGFSGCFMPRTWLPEQMQTASLITPHAWALLAYEQLLLKKVPDLLIVWRNCGMLVLFAAAYFAIGWWRFRKYD